jgi:dTDP-glucose 4,6-dehydratase
MRSFSTILVTGGAGFIGTNFIQYLFGKAGFNGRVVNLDALTYAGNPENLAEVEKAHGGKRYFFERGDICDRARVEGLFDKYKFDAVVHFAAESHVDRSILGPEAFMRTNVMGTYTLLDVARKAWAGRDDVIFHHISTDEVWGRADLSARIRPTTREAPIRPRRLLRTIWLAPITIPTAFPSR